MVVAIRSLPPSAVEMSLSFAIAAPPRDRMRSATCCAIVESFPNPDTSVPRSFTTTRAPRSARSSTYARPPATCASHNRDLSLQRNSFCHLAILLPARFNASPCDRDAKCWGAMSLLAKPDYHGSDIEPAPVLGQTLNEVYHARRQHFGRRSQNARQLGTQEPKS